jgi:alpha-galactosidase
MARRLWVRASGAAALLLAAASFRTGETVWLDTLEVSLVRQMTGEAKANLATTGGPLSIGGKEFKRGLGTHADSRFFIDLKGGATRFRASVGVDDMAGDAASVKFRVLGDRKLLFQTELMHVRDAAVEIDVDVSGVRTLALCADDCNDGNKEDKSDWAEARIEVTGEKPIALPAPVCEPVGPLTPPPGPEPRINGPRAIGVRPGSPFLYKIPATGRRPMTFSAAGLPEGLSLDPATGLITGKLEKRGESKIELSALNESGEARRPLRLVCGDRIALTPPMGWSSRGLRGEDLSQAKVRAAADALVAAGLDRHGWSFISIHDGWQGTRPPPSFALQPNERFPDLPGLCGDLHGMGFKVGLYSTPWRVTHQGFTGGSADDEKGEMEERGRTFGKVSFHAQDARQFSAWGVDGLLYEWVPVDAERARPMADALRSLPRDLLFILSPGEDPGSAAPWAALADAWLAPEDALDRWSRIEAAGFGHDAWREVSGPGRWAGPGPLFLDAGGPGFHPSTGLTESEQVSHMSLWCLLGAPLLLAGDPAKWADEKDERARFARGLLTNDEVIDVDQDPLGKPARRVASGEGFEIWDRELEDGSRAVGLFNLSDLGTSTLKVTWKDLGREGKQAVRDLWRHKDLGEFETAFEAAVKSHGALLVRIRPAGAGRP